MKLSLKEKVILRLLLEIKRQKGEIRRKRDMMVLEKLAFLVAHGEFDESGNVSGVRVFPRLDLNFRIYFRGIHSRDVYDIVDRLETRGLLIKDEHNIRPLVKSEDILEINDPEVAKATENAARYAKLEPQDLEKLTDRLLHLEEEVAKALVFNTAAIRLLKAEEDARKLKAQGLLVDI